MRIENISMAKKKIIAIPGSTRQQSSNLSIINAIVDLYADDLSITIYNGIGHLPQFNPDDDVTVVKPEVAHFRQLLADADGILICTPEYARGVPGALKNAIDWTVSSSSFPNKPTVLITASTDGNYGHRALMETLKAIEAGNVEQLQMVIPFVKTKISTGGKITDASTFAELQSLMARFISCLENRG
jgi:chromate reductase